MRKEAESIVDRVEAEREAIANADTETRARLAGMIGLYALVGRLEANPKTKMIIAVCVPEGLPRGGLHGLVEDDHLSTARFIEGGKGVYSRKK